MIIDKILDRKDNEEWAQQDNYDARAFYFDCMEYSANFDGAFDYITAALDYGTEDDARRALCKYIDDGDYNPNIKKYINARKWLE